jgi:hypothetical protein
MFSAEHVNHFSSQRMTAQKRLAIRYSAVFQRHAHSPFVSRSRISGDRIALRATASGINIGEFSAHQNELGGAGLTPCGWI